MDKVHFGAVLQAVLRQQKCMIKKSHFL